MDDPDAHEQRDHEGKVSEEKAAARLKQLKLQSQKTEKRILRSKVMRLMDEKLKTGDDRRAARRKRKKQDLRLNKDRKLTTAYKQFRETSDQVFRRRPLVHTSGDEYFLRHPEGPALPRISTTASTRYLANTSEKAMYPRYKDIANYLRAKLDLIERRKPETENKVQQICKYLTRGEILDVPYPHLHHPDPFTPRSEKTRPTSSA